MLGQNSAFSNGVSFIDVLDFFEALGKGSNGDGRQSEMSYEDGLKSAIKEKMGISEEDSDKFFNQIDELVAAHTDQSSLPKNIQAIFDDESDGVDYEALATQLGGQLIVTEEQRDAANRKIGNLRIAVQQMVNHTVQDLKTILGTHDLCHKKYEAQILADDIKIGFYAEAMRNSDEEIEEIIENLKAGAESQMTTEELIEKLECILDFNSQMYDSTLEGRRVNNERKAWREHAAAAAEEAKAAEQAEASAEKADDQVPASEDAAQEQATAEQTDAPAAASSEDAPADNASASSEPAAEVADEESPADSAGQEVAEEHLGGFATEIVEGANLPAPGSDPNCMLNPPEGQQADHLSGDAQDQDPQSLKPGASQE